MTDQFIKYITAERRYSPLTARNYRRDIEEYLAYMEVGDKDFTAPEHFTPETVRGWIISLSESGRLGPATINRKVSSLRSLYNWLRKNDMATKDPFTGVARLKTPKRLPVFITQNKLLAVIEDSEASEDNSFINKRNSLIIFLFYATGIRLAELISIRLSDFSADLRELKVKGKGDKERVIPVIDSLRYRITDYTEVIRRENICFCDKNWLFLTSKGKQVSRTEVYNIVKGALQRAGVQGKVSPHVLRHTFATHLLNDGADMREIQELMGHSSLSATEIYTHNNIAKLKEVYNTAHPRAGKHKR